MLHHRAEIVVACYLASLFTLGCGRPNHGNAPKKSGKERSVMLSLIPDTGRRSASGTEVAFRFRNNSANAVQLPGYFGSPPKDGVLHVGYVDYEIWVGGEWRRLDIGYDGKPEYYPVQPGETIRVLITLGPFEKQGVSGDTSIRVVLGEYISEAFNLDSAIGAKK